MQAFEELFELAKELNTAAAAREATSIATSIDAVRDAANEVARSFSGSWLGYHSQVYYEGLVPTPAGAHFSQEWGLKHVGGLGSHGEWREYDPEDVRARIYQLAKDADLSPAREAAKRADVVFDRAKSEILSILENELDSKADSFLAGLKSKLEKMEPVSKGEVAQHWAPTGQVITRDMIALGQKTRVPPHIDVLSDVTSICHSFDICKAAADISLKAASHLERKSRKKTAVARVGTNVFIGHGRSNIWRELKDFVQDRLQLPWDEFNRVPVAGVTNIARLSEMLDAAAIALLVMTAEDELADGEMQARMNVVHEAGLFQGRLGFTRAIVLLEEGCKEFSNIQGLGQIHFPKGNIAAAFEEVRRVLEREGLIGDVGC